MSAAMDRRRQRKLSAYHRELLADILGDVGTGAVESAPMDYGPSIGPGTVYTDKTTITAVQKALVSRGYSVGRSGADGIFGKDTEAALFKFSGKHGPPDDATLASLGVVSAAQQQAAKAVALASTPAQVKAAAAKVVQSAPPGLRAEAAQAQAQAQAATTPEEIAAAKNKLQEVANKATGGGGFFSTNIPVINVPLWQALLGALGLTAIGIGGYKLMGNGSPRRRYARR